MAPREKFRRLASVGSVPTYAGLAPPALSSPDPRARQLAQAILGRPAIPRGGQVLLSNGLQFPSQLGAVAASNNRYQRASVPMFAPPWAAHSWEFLLPNYYLSGKGQETAGPVPIGVSYVTAFNSAGTAFPCYFPDGQLSGTVAPNDDVWVSAPGLTTTASEKLLVFVEYFVNVGDRNPVGFYLVLKGQGGSALASNDLGGGRESDSASDPSKRLTGALVGGSPSNAQAWGPAVARCKGWNGRAPNDLLWGDSRLYETEFMNHTLANQRATSGVAAALSDAASGAMSYANFSGPGAWATDTATDHGTAKRWAIIESCENLPFHNVWTSLNGNDINNGSIAQDLATMQSVNRRLWAQFRRRAPRAKIYHLYGYPWADQSNNAAWTTVADQVPAATATAPGGMQQQVDGWLDGGPGIPAHVTPINLGPVLADATQTDHWAVPSPAINGVFVSIAGRTVVVDLAPGATPLAPAMVLVIGKGLSTWETFQITAVTAVAGDRYTVVTAQAATKAHVAGDAVGVSFVRSAAHPGGYLEARVAAEILIPLKLSGVVQTKIPQPNGAGLPPGTLGFNFSDPNQSLSFAI